MASRGSIRMARASNKSGEQDQSEALRMRTATITAVNKTVSPWKVSINIGATIYSDATMLGWLDPQVGDIVKVLQQGAEILILGPLAPGKVYVPTTPPPAPATPPASVLNPPAPVVTRTVAIAATGSSTGPSEEPLDGWRSDRLYQGGYARAQRSFWWYGTQIATAKGAGTILGGTIFIRRWDASIVAGVNGGANVRLGGHNFASQPGTIPGAHTGVAVVGELTRGEGKTFDIPQAVIDGFNNGTLKGIGLEPGAAGYQSPDYLVCYPFGLDMEWSGSLSLTIRG